MSKPAPAAGAATVEISGTSFAALRHPTYRAYCALTALSMLGDNIEHVVSYWALWQAFQSPMLQGFAVIAHWSPMLLFGVQFGHLADRYDCRRLIQIGQTLFAALSVCWAILLLTGMLQPWHAMVLLVVHGFCGTLWGPPSQVIIHDIVGAKHLQSAVRLNATARQLGLLVGPWIGGVLMLNLTPSGALLLNALLYLPLIVWLMRAPYTGHAQQAGVAAARGGGLRWSEALHVLAEVRGNRAVVSMIALGGLSSLLVGSAFQVQMPGYAQALGTGNAGFAYAALLGANAAGAFVGGLLLEGTGLLRPNARTAIICGALWCVAIGGFAAAGIYPLAVALLFVAGIFNLAFTSMAQTLVQLLAPPEKRGRVVGLYSMANMGLRVGSGVTIGVLASVIGIHWALGLSAGILLVLMLALLTYVRGGQTEPGLVPAAGRGAG